MTRPERHQQIILLDRTLTDFDYQPPTWTGALVRRQGKAGEGPTTTQPCSRAGCEDGVVRIRGIERTCEQCSGRGLEVVDAYTERKVRTLEQEIESPDRMVRCDECGATGKSVWWRNGDELDNTCRRCWGAKVVPAPSHPIRPFRNGVSLSANASDLGRGDPVLACMEKRELAGSYNELGLALACLRLQHRGIFRLHVRVFIEALCEEDDVDGSELFLLDQSLRYLDALMPVEIRVPSWAKRFEERRRERVEQESKVA
jgi:hypothetical protein